MQLNISSGCYHTAVGKLIGLSSVQAVGDSSKTPMLPKEHRLHIYDLRSNLRFLIDSGSVISLVPRSACTWKLKPSSLTLHAANNSKICTYGEYPLNVNLGLRRDFRWSFIIADVSAAIIGADFLVHYGLLLDLRTQRLMDPLTQLQVPAELCETTVFSISTVNSSCLPATMHDSYAKLLHEFIDITLPNTVPKVEGPDSVQHHIVTTGPPVFERPRRLNSDKLAIAKQDFNLLLHHGVIRPSSSQWASPIHMVQKKTGGWRTTGDYRKLNSQTIPDRYPVPHAEDIFQRLGGKKIFSTLDLIRAYHQVPVSPEDVPKTAVTTPFGLFEFLGMPPGLRNATQTFQRHMDNALRNIDFAACFIDDVIVFSESHEEHIQHLRCIFKLLQHHKLTINIDKCQFAKKEVLYLGFTINEHGYLPPQDKVQAITTYPKPETVSDLRRFLGMINYYRRCVPHAAQIQAPLNEYLKGARKKDKRKIDWNESSTEAFEACKNSIVSATRTSFISTTAPLSLFTDASDTAIGAVLEQLVGDRWTPVGFFSRKLSAAERNWSTYDRELLAIFASIKFFKHQLEGRQFLVKTDHRPLVYAFSQRADRASPRQLRQLDFISQFTTEIVHVSGEDNAVADALSRIGAISMPSILSPATIHAAQEVDDELQSVRENSSLNLQQLFIDNISILCDVSDGIVRPYLPANLRRTAFDIVHGPAHPSRRATMQELRKRFVWPSIRKDAVSWARQCLPCQRSKIQRHNQINPDRIRVPDNRFEHIHMDLIYLPPVKNFKYCLTIIDRFSRWPIAVPLQNMEAKTVATACYENWICQFGTPLYITTDQGTQFESALFTALAQLIGAKTIHTTPYHPQSNGIVERWHRTLKAALMCHESVPWIEILPTVLLGLRTCLKEDLQASPAELVFGTPLRIPGEFFMSENMESDPLIFLDSFREHIRRVRPTPTAHHTKSRCFILKDLHTCSHVFRRVDSVRKPLDAPYTGPHEVVRRVNDRVFVIRQNGTEVTVSIDSLKPAYVVKQDSQSTPLDPVILPEHVPRSSTMDRPIRTYQRKVSFPCPPGKVSKEGVAVAPLPIAQQVGNPPNSARRRKQILQPRPE